MRRHHKKKESGEINLGFQIAPMIDVVFVIMLFFMVMAGAVQVENAHNTKLPGTVSRPEGGELPPDEIAIRIEEDGQVYLNEDPLDTPEAKLLPELAKNLFELKVSSEASKSPVLVTIYASEQSKYEHIDRARIENVTFQAGAPE